jgi:hypothetical protein
VSAVFVVICLGVAVAVLVAMAMSFFVRRHGESNLPAEDWRRTDEIFVDPSTNRRMRVWIDPVDQTRHYVDEQ